jgi:hypothetical protein
MPNLLSWAVRITHLSGMSISSYKIVLIPFAEFQTWLDGMNVTETEERSYRHVSIFKEKGRLTLHRKKGFDRIDLTNYLIKDTDKK